MKSTSTNYGKLAVALHWLSLLLILVLAPLGAIMVRLGDNPIRERLYPVHAAIGVTVLLLTLARVLWRSIDPDPEPPQGIAGKHLTLFKAVHFLLYVALLSLTITGLGMLNASGVGLSLGSLSPSLITAEMQARAGHSLISKLFIALFAAHLGGVLLHQFQKGDILHRMGINWFQKKAA
jgi:cytochrome b561